MMAQLDSTTASEFVTEVEITLSCRNLPDTDVFSKSDPMCVTYLKTQDSQWQEISRTETIWNNLNPDFAKKTHLIYRFEEQQSLKFVVYDIDSESHNLQKHDFLGYSSCTLGQLVAAGKLVLPLRGLESNQGTIIVCIEELSKCRDEVILQFSGHRIERMSWFGLTDPFLEIYKINDDGEYHLVHRTEVIKWSLNPTWKPFTIAIRSLCGHDSQRSLKIKCYHWNMNGGHQFIGEFFTTFKTLSLGPCDDTVFFCLNSQKMYGDSRRKHSGEIHLTKYEYKRVYSFLDYIKGGMQIHCTIAIDFTSSNGRPNSPQSLHYCCSPSPNEYEQALTAVGEIIQDYDTDKMFPVLGFGARLPPDGHTSHDFFVNMKPSNPYCVGIPGVLEAYKSCIRKIELYGPTLFSPIINHVAKFAQAYQDGSHYFVLLIITDGIINDMAKTKQAIINAATLPMSIIIVGVGTADFSAMDELDGDTVPLVHKGVQAARDIVQFVPFRNFHCFQNVTKTKASLAKEVLAEIPDQIVSFMKCNNIQPKKVENTSKVTTAV
ncbi:hypothetical protein R5R35_000911 [Gryllus longicercus]|uniref:C2 domain-containing protein n=1 Tax=Gryllus longicercus TaxID=2509291 RepID=A0AAN9VBB0_9ORTH